MKTTFTKQFTYFFLVLFTFISCVENELLEEGVADEPAKALEKEINSPDWVSKRPKLNFKELNFQEPNYDSLFTVNLSVESVQGFIGSGENINENAWTMLQQKIASSSPQTKAFFENADVNTLKDILDPSVKMDEGVENFFKDLFESESLGLILPAKKDRYLRKEFREDLKTNNTSFSESLRSMDGWGGEYYDPCEEDVYFFSNGMRKGLSDWMDGLTGDIYAHYSDEAEAAEDRYIERRDLLDLLYKERVMVINTLVEQALVLAYQAGFTNTAAIRNQVQQLGIVYAYFIRTQLEYWYETGLELNDILLDRERQIIDEQREAKLEEQEDFWIERAMIILDWEDGAIKECAETGEFTYLDYNVVFDEDAFII